jgi:hypothetical protein
MAKSKRINGADLQLALKENNKKIKEELNSLIDSLPNNIREYANKATAATTTNLDELTGAGIWYEYNKVCTGVPEELEGEKILVFIKNEILVNITIQTLIRVSNGVINTWQRRYSSTGEWGGWENNITSKDMENLRTMYANPSKIPVGTDVASLLDMINAMDNYSSVTFWIGSYTNIRNEIITGLSKYGITSTYGNVTIDKSGSTTHITYKGYSSTSIYMATYTTTNDKGWTEWEQIPTQEELSKKIGVAAQYTRITPTNSISDILDIDKDNAYAELNQSKLVYQKASDTTAIANMPPAFPQGTGFVGIRFVHYFSSTNILVELKSFADGTSYFNNYVTSAWKGWTDNDLDNCLNKSNPTGTGSIVIGENIITDANTVSGFGKDLNITADYAHAEGNGATASGIASHAEGCVFTHKTTTNGSDFTYTDYFPTASGEASHAEGSSTASGDYSHAEGNMTTASGDYSHAEGYRTIAETFYSHAEGNETTASGNSSHTEGYKATASGNSSHAEGNYTTASGNSSHAEGNYTTASGNSSHAEGNETDATGYVSHAEGDMTTASGNSSHAEGYKTTALAFQHAQGHFNNTTTATANTNSGTSDGTAFVIGNGTNSSASNAMRVTGKGQIYAPNTTILSGADYAEYFEWADGNPNKEDRVGYFVTIDEDNPEKIRIAQKEDGYILGIISGLPSVIGNGDEDWKKRYVLDDFGRYIEETFEYEETVMDEETGEESIVTKTGTKWKENPEYDSSKIYVPRDLRPEWSAVGMVGILSVYDDGTCQVNGYCKCSDGGIATSASVRSFDTYRVIKRVADNIIKVIIKP